VDDLPDSLPGDSKCFGQETKRRNPRGQIHAAPALDQEAKRLGSFCLRKDNRIRQVSVREPDVFIP
jgi:hypothetical protein